MKHRTLADGHESLVGHHGNCNLRLFEVSPIDHPLGYGTKVVPGLSLIRFPRRKTWNTRVNRKRAVPD
jgi:hypothetical protein